MWERSPRVSEYFKFRLRPKVEVLSSTVVALDCPQFMVIRMLSLGNTFSEIVV